MLLLEKEKHAFLSDWFDQDYRHIRAQLHTHNQRITEVVLQFQFFFISIYLFVLLNLTTFFFYLILTTASEMRSCVTTVSHSVHTCSMSQLEGEKKHTVLLFYKCRHPPFSGALLSLRKINLKHKSNSPNKYKEQR